MRSSGHAGNITLQIRDTIKIARQHEDKQHTLERFLAAKIPMLHRNISLPSEDASASLLAFVTRYVEHVPDVLEALTDLTLDADAYDFAKPVLEIVEGYFHSPPEFISQEHSGLHALIDEAYLAHRLIEEVNDRMMILSGVPLAPMDMTISNLVVHDILGEEFANELDSAVSYNVDLLFNMDDLPYNKLFRRYVEHHIHNGWHKELEKWPCLAGDSSIFLVINSEQQKPTLH